MHWNLNYVTEVWYKNSYTLKDSIYRYGLHKYYKTVHLILILQLQHEINFSYFSQSCSINANVIN